MNNEYYIKCTSIGVTFTKPSKHYKLIKTNQKTTRGHHKKALLNYFFIKVKIYTNRVKLLNLSYVDWCFPHSETLYVQ